MGGNDNGLFGTLLNGCTQIDVIEKLTAKAPCKEKYETYVQETFAEDKGPQEAALVHIKELAPNAKVFVVGYPEITPKKGHCPTFPWHEADLKWFRDKVQKVGNSEHQGRRESARRDLRRHVQAEPRAQRLRTGRHALDRTADGSLTGVPVHPNAIGEEQDAFDVEFAM